MSLKAVPRSQEFPQPDNLFFLFLCFFSIPFLTWHVPNAAFLLGALGIVPPHSTYAIWLQYTMAEDASHSRTTTTKCPTRGLALLPDLDLSSLYWGGRIWGWRSDANPHNVPAILTRGKTGPFHQSGPRSSCRRTFSCVVHLAAISIDPTPATHHETTRRSTTFHAATVCHVM